MDTAKRAIFTAGSQYPSFVGATVGGCAAILGTASAIRSPFIMLVVALGLIGIREHRQKKRSAPVAADDKAEPLLDAAVKVEQELKERESEVHRLQQLNSELVQRVTTLEVELAASLSAQRLSVPAAAPAPPQPIAIAIQQQRSPSIEIATTGFGSARGDSLLSTSPPNLAPIAPLSNYSGRLPSSAYVRPAATFVHPAATAATLRNRSTSWSEHDVVQQAAIPPVSASPASPLLDVLRRASPLPHEGDSVPRSTASGNRHHLTTPRSNTRVVPRVFLSR